MIQRIYIYHPYMHVYLISMMTQHVRLVRYLQYVNTKSSEYQETIYGYLNIFEWLFGNLIRCIFEPIFSFLLLSTIKAKRISFFHLFSLLFHHLGHSHLSLDRRHLHLTLITYMCNIYYMCPVAIHGHLCLFLTITEMVI